MQPYKKLSLWIPPPAFPSPHEAVISRSVGPDILFIAFYDIGLPLFFRFQLILNCWNEDPSARPTFDLAAKSLEKMMMEGTPYFDFDLLDESNAYYYEKPLEEGDTS